MHITEFKTREILVDTYGLANTIIYLLNIDYVSEETAHTITTRFLNYEISVRSLWTPTCTDMGVSDIETMIIDLDINDADKERIIFRCTKEFDNIQILMNEYLQHLIPMRTWDIINLRYYSMFNYVIENLGDYRIQDWVKMQLKFNTEYNKLYSRKILELTNDTYILS